MLSEKEKAFLQYWEANRIKQKKSTRNVLIGLGIGIVAGVPIFINLLSGWYERAQMVANSQTNLGVLVFAILLIGLFIGLFYTRFKWETNEQYYQELLLKNKAQSSDNIN